MNLAILKDEVQSYITIHLEDNIPTLLFKKTPFSSVSIKELVAQIEAKKKCKKKLPTWFSAANIYYPNKLNIAQTSSEVTANYKAQLVQGTSLADITGGFGVDSVSFSKRVSQVHHIEANAILSKIASHNFDQLGRNNIETFNEEGISFIQESNDHFDWIYIDPSRRNIDKKRVFYLRDCEPNIPDHLDFLLSKTSNILIKTGPLLDLQAGISQLRFIKEIHIVAVENDVKEILWIVEKDFKALLKVKTINLTNKGDGSFDFYLNDSQDANAQYSKPLDYLYEPNAAILKSGAFNLIGIRYGLKKLHPNSHLYTSNDCISFLGRTFKIRSKLAYNKKVFSKLGIKKANVTTRNFPDSVATIRKKLKITDGGADYLFFTKIENGDCIIIFCEKL